MLKKKNIRALLPTAAFGLLAAALSACSSTPLPPDTGCGVPGGLCAPAATSASPPPAEPSYTPPPPAAPVQTNPIEILPPTGSRPLAADLNPSGARIALLLPLQSDALAQPAEAVRAGFMAGYERDRGGVTVNVIPTGDSSQATLDAYARAAEQHDIVVGPLARPAVAALATSGAVTRPTIALNHPQTNGPLPRQMLVVGLSLEDEARQVADWAAAEQPGARALVLTGKAAWQQRLSGAFTARWAQLGLNNMVVELPSSDGYVDANALAELRSRMQVDQPQLVFAALDAVQLRQVRSAIGTSLPTYGTASINPGRDPGSAAPELAGVRILDLPWAVQPEHPLVASYPRWGDTSNGYDMQRLYALGIDAFRIARQLALRPDGAFELDGVTGRLSVDMGAGASAFRRVETGTVYRDGAFEAVAFGR
ncbi:penicillin-binding protein activator [Massilia sp. IC2-476]|uniref:penicillin-binding protein activator n=1 Tax=Massilia sp. IC2-476 TaxID=2887199 RepID=UPI001D1154BF|nr:penicillin-binding protein activator [Massilia sp. IC2-476]MCC2972849.1 penicillin-binding protein activator [Massilia sp. IC2-476]